MTEMKYSPNDIRNMPDGDILLVARNRNGGTHSVDSFAFDIVGYRSGPKPDEPLQIEDGCRVRLKNHRTTTGFVLKVSGYRAWPLWDGETEAHSIYHVDQLHVIGPAKNPWNFEPGSSVIVSHLGGESPGTISSIDPSGATAIIANDEGKPNWHNFKLAHLKPGPEKLKLEIGCTVSHRDGGGTGVVHGIHGDKIWLPTMPFTPVRQAHDFVVIKAAPKSS